MTHALFSLWDIRFGGLLDYEDEIECLKVLLEAGADPTTSYGVFTETFFTRTSQDGSMVITKLSADLAWC